MQPPEVEALSASLRAAYQQAQAALEAELGRIEANPAQYRRVSRLRELQRSVEAMTDTLDQQAADWLSKDFPTVYALGAQSAGEFAWTQADRFAITELAQDTFDELLAATQHVDDATKRLIRKLGKSQSLLKMTTGQTATHAGKALRKTLERSGISTVTYKNGARHGIGEYASMMLRTTTARAYNAGTVNFGDRTGTKFYEVFDGSNDAGCARANGSIVDGDWAREFPVEHPNCQRSFAARPELRTRKEANEAKSLRTPEQMADQAASEQVRAAKQKRRAQSRRKVEARKARTGPRTSSARRTPIAAQPALDPSITRAVVEGDWTPHARAEIEAAAAALNADYVVPLKRVVMDPDRLSAGKSNDTIYLPKAWNDDAFMAKRAKEWRNLSVDQGRAATVTHEYGHILDGALQRDRPDLYKRFNAFLEEPVELHGRMVPRIQHGLEAPSPYGTENRYEFAAEAFADWRKNGTDAHPSSQFVGRLMDEAFRRRGT